MERLKSNIINKVSIDKESECWNFTGCIQKNGNAYYPTKKLLASFTVTREMREYLGLDDIELNLGKPKRKNNTIFDTCKQSPATKRILWFYGRGELPGLEVAR
jgi:hypothetical protein